MWFMLIVVMILSGIDVCCVIVVLSWLLLSVVLNMVVVLENIVGLLNVCMFGCIIFVVFVFVLSVV